MKQNRREFLIAAAAATATGGASVPSSFAAGAKNDRKITVEEGFSIPEIAKEMIAFTPSEDGRRGGWMKMAEYYADLIPEWGPAGNDLGARRIAAMDASGIDMQLLLLSGSGVQVLEAKRSTELMKLSNDRLAEAVRSHHTRFAGLTALAPHDPRAAVLELERGVTKLGLKGAVINSNARGEYLDDRKFWPIFEAAAALKAPIYLHPSLPAPQMLEPYLDYGLVGPMWGFNAEASIHALRVIMSGVFDAYPGLQIVLGHLGEGIPFFLTRIDIQADNTRNRRQPKLKRKPSEYFFDNFTITTSGMNASPAVMFCKSLLGAERMMFAIDYPYEPMPREAAAMAAQPLTEAEFEAIYHGTAERVFRL